MEINQSRIDIIMFVGLALSMAGSYLPEPLKSTLVVMGFGTVLVTAFFSEWILKVIVSDYPCLKITLDTTGETFCAYLDNLGEDKQLKSSTWERRVKAHWPNNIANYGTFDEFVLESDLLPLGKRLKDAWDRRQVFFWNEPVMHGLTAHLIVREYPYGSTDRWRDKCVPAFKVAHVVGGDSAIGLPLPTEFMISSMRKLTDNVRDVETVQQRILTHAKDVEALEFRFNQAHSRAEHLRSYATKEEQTNQAKDSVNEGMLATEMDVEKRIAMSVLHKAKVYGDLLKLAKHLSRGALPIFNWQFVAVICVVVGGLFGLGILAIPDLRVGIGWWFIEQRLFLIVMGVIVVIGIYFWKKRR